MALGRPSKYSEEIVDQICEKIATTNRGLKKICDSNKDFPSFSTVFHWFDDPEKSSFLDKYARARQAQAELLADEIIEIADDSSEDEIENEDGSTRTNHDHINRSRLRVDARKWKASKLAPKKYGDKLEIEQHAVIEKQTFKIGDQEITFD